MRTTLDLDDNLLKRARRRAAEREISLTKLIEEALAAALAPPKRGGKPYVFRWKTHKGEYIGGVDIADRTALYEVMGGRW